MMFASRRRYEPRLYGFIVLFTSLVKMLRAHRCLLPKVNVLAELVAVVSSEERLRACSRKGAEKAGHGAWFSRATFVAAYAGARAFISLRQYESEEKRFEGARDRQRRVLLRAVRA